MYLKAAIGYVIVEYDYLRLIRKIYASVIIEKCLYVKFSALLRLV